MDGQEQAGSPADTTASDVIKVSAQDDHSGSGSTTAAANGLLAQLQQLISNVASAPVTREFAAKAAELAALAAEKTGPAARSLASRTEELSHSMAERATTFASSMRADDPTDGSDADTKHADTDAGGDTTSSPN
jgi:hypothetical protein